MALREAEAKLPIYQNSRLFLKRCPLLCSRRLLTITPILALSMWMTSAFVTRYVDGRPSHLDTRPVRIFRRIGMNGGCTDAWQGVRSILGFY